MLQLNVMRKINADATTRDRQKKSVPLLYSTVFEQMTTLANKNFGVELTPSNESLLQFVTVQSETKKILTTTKRMSMKYCLG